MTALSNILGLIAIVVGAILIGTVLGVKVGIGIGLIGWAALPHG